MFVVLYGHHELTSVGTVHAEHDCVAVVAVMCGVSSIGNLEAVLQVTYQ